MVDDEIEVGPVQGGLFEVHRPARLFVDAPSGSPLCTHKFLMPRALAFPRTVGDLSSSIRHAFSPISAPAYIFQASIFSSLTWRSISSGSGLPRSGRKSPCDKTRRDRPSR